MAKGALATARMLALPPQASQHKPSQVTHVAQWQRGQERQLAQTSPVSALPRSVAPGLAVGTLVSAATVAASVRRARLAKRLPVARPRARHLTRCRATTEGASRSEAAVRYAARFDFSKLWTYPVEDLEALYIDSKWCFYNEDKKILEDSQFDSLKEELKKLGSNFATLGRKEVAFIEASIAYYQGQPIVSDEEYKKLRQEVSMSGRRKDVTAFLLNARGKQFLDDSQMAKMKEAFVLATQVNFDKLDKYPMAELEELYIDALWCYYCEKRALLSDKQYDTLKRALYARESRFPTLTQAEVAFVEASIAWYRGEPLVSDEEFDRMKAEVEKSGVRKEVTAFLLYERGEQFLDSAQFTAMKEEYERLGISAVDLEQCNLAQLEEMYVDAIWAYYKDGVQLLSDQQYDKLREELQWQGSGFPTLKREEVDFVKASISYWRGEPVASDEEWQELKSKVLADRKRKDVTAFLLYSKGSELLDPDTFQEMSQEMAKLGVTVQKSGTKAREQTLSITSDKLSNDFGQVIYMVAALAAIPTILCTVIVWSLGLFLDFEFVPQAEWGSVLSLEFIPLFLLGLVLGVAVTSRLLVFLDLQNPEILAGQCPSCGAEVKLFSGGAHPPEEVSYSCKSCGVNLVLNTKQRKIKSAGLGAKIEGEAEWGGFDWKKAWSEIKGVSKQIKEALVDA